MLVSGRDMTGAPSQRRRGLIRSGPLALVMFKFL